MRMMTPHGGSHVGSTSAITKPRWRGESSPREKEKERHVHDGGGGGGARFNVESAACRRNNTPGNYPPAITRNSLVPLSHANRTQRDPPRRARMHIPVCGTRDGPRPRAEGRARSCASAKKRKIAAWCLHARNMPEVIGESRKGSSTTRETA